MRPQTHSRVSKSLPDESLHAYKRAKWTKSGQNGPKWALIGLKPLCKGVKKSIFGSKNESAYGVGLRVKSFFFGRGFILVDFLTT